jgi:trimeric autotransporter adhesin
MPKVSCVCAHVILYCFLQGGEAGAEERLARLAAAHTAACTVRDKRRVQRDALVSAYEEKLTAYKGLQGRSDEAEAERAARTRSGASALAAAAAAAAGGTSGSSAVLSAAQRRQQREALAAAAGAPPVSAEARAAATAAETAAVRRQLRAAWQLLLVLIAERNLGQWETEALASAPVFPTAAVAVTGDSSSSSDDTPVDDASDNNSGSATTGASGVSGATAGSPGGVHSGAVTELAVAKDAAKLPLLTGGRQEIAALAAVVREGRQLEATLAAATAADASAEAALECVDERIKQLASQLSEQTATKALCPTPATANAAATTAGATTATAGAITATAGTTTAAAVAATAAVAHKVSAESSKVDTTVDVTTATPLRIDDQSDSSAAAAAAADAVVLPQAELTIVDAASASSEARAALITAAKQHKARPSAGSISGMHTDVLEAVCTPQIAVADSSCTVISAVAALPAVAAPASDTVPTKSTSFVIRVPIAGAIVSSTTAAFETAAAADSSAGTGSSSNTALTQEEVEAAMRDAMQERTTLTAAARKVRTVEIT